MFSTDADRRIASRINWITIAVAVVLIYLFSYLVARQFFGLRIHGGALDPDGVTFRAFLPDAALDGLNIVYFPMRRVDAKWTGTEVRFERIRSKTSSGSSIEL